MKITNLKLKNFRNHENINLEFSEYKNIIIGNNYSIEKISKYYIRRNKKNVFVRITIEDDDFIEGKVRINRIDNKKKKKKKTVHNSKVLNSYDDSVLLKDYYKKIEKKWCVFDIIQKGDELYENTF